MVEQVTVTWRSIITTYLVPWSCPALGKLPANRNINSIPYLALPETHWFSSVLFHFLCKEFKVNSEVNSNESGVWFEENLIQADSKLHSLFWTSPTCNSLVVLNFTLLPSVSDQNLYLSVTSTGWIVFRGKNLGCLIEAKSPASAPRLQPHVTGHQFDTFDF